MCGLVFAIHGDVTGYRLSDFFNDAMLASQVRGTDATGIFQVDKQGQLWTKKKAINATEFLEDQQVTHVVRDVYRSPLTVGHVRHATSGDKDDDLNAHPFVFEREDKSRVVGVHNGTLKGWKDKKNSEEIEVDSAWAIGMIAQEGLDAFTHFDGAFAFIWWDSNEPDYVWIARNDERSLYFYQSEDGKSIMGASELGMLGWLTNKHGYHKHKDGDTGLHYFKADKAYKLSIQNIGHMKEVELPKYDPSTTIQKAMVPVSSPVNYYPMSGNPNVTGVDEVPFAMGPTGAIQSRIGTVLTTTRGNTRTPSTKDIYPQVVKAKLALRKARDRRLGRSPHVEEKSQVVTGDMLDEQTMDGALQYALNKEAVNRKLDPWLFVKGNHRVSQPNSKVAGAEEIANAVWNKVYGRVIPLMGVDYDDDTCELLGEAFVQDEFGKDLNVDCILRGLPRKVANDVYINGPDPILVAVVGMIEPKGLEPPMYVVANLDLNNRLELARLEMRKEAELVLSP